ncbi:M1 family peptidase, partial [Nocardioides sp. Y6]|nr:M1 family peptidase [Nocardioides malaquae]
NMRAKDSKTPLIEGSGVSDVMRPSQFVSTFMKERFDGGFNIEEVSDTSGDPLPHMINRTMMRIELPEVLKSGDKFSFNVKWWY